MWLVRRITRRDEDHSVECEHLTRLARNGHMAIVNGVEGTAENKTHTRRHWSDLSGGASLKVENHEIVPMDDFLVLLRPKTLLNLGGLEAL